MKYYCDIARIHIANDDIANFDLLSLDKVAFKKHANKRNLDHFQQEQAPGLSVGLGLWFIVCNCNDLYHRFQWSTAESVWNKCGIESLV